MPAVEIWLNKYVQNVIRVEKVLYIRVQGLRNTLVLKIMGAVSIEEYK